MTLYVKLTGTEAPYQVRGRLCATRQSAVLIERENMKIYCIGSWENEERGGRVRDPPLQSTKGHRYRLSGAEYQVTAGGQLIGAAFGGDSHDSNIFRSVDLSQIDIANERDF